MGVGAGFWFTFTFYFWFTSSFEELSHNGEDALSVTDASECMGAVLCESTLFSPGL